jgi:hypothetical protein
MGVSGGPVSQAEMDRLRICFRAPGHPGAHSHRRLSTVSAIARCRDVCGRTEDGGWFHPEGKPRPAPMFVCGPPRRTQ